MWYSENFNGMRENAKFPNGTGFDRYSGSWIRHNLGTGCGIGEVKGLRDRNDRTSGCGTVVKMERQFGIGRLFRRHKIFNHSIIFQVKRKTSSFFIQC